VALVKQLARARIAVPIAQHERRVVRDCDGYWRFRSEFHAGKRTAYRATSLTCSVAEGASVPVKSPFVWLVERLK
jgi:hypothetical protein